eukprot:CAMPEP_0176094266 /NCGR_PEP_ID=MMETSP0120_2-20121206/47238_1 /TAXON_ID=160619 /ORGANISM="Kryptoperidinium foliaceum, Strain CCMP 1326" /LENGTH=308 /DNA_ID=CAMNT_0017428209 /DNA_START=10 /DNA_END=936 /DNA_ORIENTATION=-
MADAAQFFANKKKKKKAFKFNANNIDAAAVEKKTHVDAPALSSGNEAVPVNNAAGPDAVESHDAGEQWDDEALAATLAQKKAIAAGGGPELLDMKALDLKRSEQGDIQEKLRVEENKAKLAAAREGMEKEAQRLKEEKEKKDQENSSAKPRFGAAAASLASSGGKWVPPHMRAGASLSSRLGGGISSTSQKLDTEDENLFPDLAAADAIIEKQKSQTPAYKVPKKTPVGGGATWGSKSKGDSVKSSQTPSEPEPKAAQAPADAVDTPAEAPAPEPVAAPASAAAAVKAPIKPKKKKKKDLSTFKPSSS